MLAFLAGCGPMPESTPTAAPPTAPAAPADATPDDPASTPATAVADELTLGDLAMRVDAAWSEVTAFRITFTGATVSPPTTLGSPIARAGATPEGTPLARSRESFVSIREVVLPDRQRQELTGLGDIDHEAIAIEDRLFLRGPLVDQIAPGTDAGVWIAIDPSTLPDGARLTQLLGGLPEAPEAPLASLPERLWPQTVRDLGTVEFDNRQCQVYGAADTVQATGMRVDYTIAIDDRGIPCFIETGTGGVTQGRDEYTRIDESFAIEPPAATPVSIPPALASPVARD